VPPAFSDPAGADPSTKALLLGLWKSDGRMTRADPASLDQDDPELTALLK
jgi:hypothetical protein